MKLKNYLILTISLLAQSIGSSQTNPLISYLPEKATMIVRIDPIRLAAKIPGESFRQSAMYRELSKGDSPLRTILANPLGTGIDFTAGILLVAEESKLENDRKPFICVFGKLRDASLFTNTISSISKETGKNIKVHGTDRILAAGKNVLAWNNEIFVIPLGYDNATKEWMQSQYNFSDSTEPDEETIKNLERKLESMQRELCFRLLSPTGKNKFSTETVLTELMNTPGDIKIWNSGSGNPITDKMIPMAGLLSEIQEFAGGTRTAVINFENGKLVAQTRNYPKGELANLYQKFPATPASMEMLQRLPGGKLLGVINTSFSSDMVREMLQKNIFKQLGDSLHNKAPFDMALLHGVFGNKAMVAVLQNEEKTNADGIEVIAAMPIIDKSKMEKLYAELKKLYESSIKEKKSDTESDENAQEKNFFGKMKPVVKFNDQWVVVSLSEETAAAFLNDPVMKPVPAWAEEFSQSPLLMQIDLNVILKMFRSKSKGNPDRNEMMMLDKFDKIIVHGGAYANGSINTTIEFRIGSNEENSLKQIFELVNSVADRSGKEEIISEGKNDKVIIQEVTITDIRQEEEKPVPPPPPPPPKSKKTPVKKKE